MRKALDTWALIAWLLGEQPAMRRVNRLLEAAEAGKMELIMSMINVGEVFYLLAKRAGIKRAEAFLDDFAGMPISTHVPVASDIVDAARIKARYPISYTDAFAAQLAIQQSAELVSGDPDMRLLESAGAIRLDWIGSR